MRDGICVRVSASCLRASCHVQSSAESFVVLRFLVAPATGSMCWKRILIAISLIPLTRPERETAMKTEMLSNRGNESHSILVSGHDFT
jgi:hypothetical protein